MNKINPKKLHHSKWTAVSPRNREKHFLVTEVEFDENGVLICCMLEAILSKQARPIRWHDLVDCNHWIQGWK